MSLAAKLEEAIVQSDSFTTWLDGLSDTDRAALEKAAGNPNLSTKRLIGIIREEGARIGDDRMNRWRQEHGFTRR